MIIQKTIAICGASGLVGNKLFAKLASVKTPDFEWNVVLVGRSAAKLKSKFPTAADCLSWEEFEDYGKTPLDAIVNLAGAEVLGGRKWDDDYKSVMRSSRIDSTKICAKLASKNPKTRFICSSAVHAYGLYSDDNHGTFTEADPPRSDGVVAPESYLNGLVREWEAATQPAIDAGASVAMCRFGVVLDSSGGALASVVPILKSFLGGPQGSGKQVMPWISLTDVVEGIHFLLNHPEVKGPVNFVIPGGGDTNEKVMQALGGALGRPAFVKMPGFVCRLAMGEAVNELVLTGQRVEPKALLDNGYKFHETDIEAYLKSLDL